MALQIQVYYFVTVRRSLARSRESGTAYPAIPDRSGFEMPERAGRRTQALTSEWGVGPPMLDWQDSGDSSTWLDRLHHMPMEIGVENRLERAA